MSFYIMTSEVDKFYNLIFENHENINFDKYFDFNIGNSILNFKDILVKTYNKGKVSDIPRLWGAGSGYPVVTERVIKIIQKYLERNVEILPLQHEKYKLFLLNIINIIDCLDKENSDIVYLPSGNIMKINKYKFNEDLLTNVHIFKIPQRSGAVFVSEELKSLIEQSKFKGFQFTKI